MPRGKGAQKASSSDTWANMTPGTSPNYFESPQSSQRRSNRLQGLSPTAESPVLLGREPATPPSELEIATEKVSKWKFQDQDQTTPSPSGLSSGFNPFPGSGQTGRHLDHIGSSSNPWGGLSTPHPPRTTVSTSIPPSSPSSTPSWNDSRSQRNHSELLGDVYSVTGTSKSSSSNTGPPHMKNRKQGRGRGLIAGGGGEDPNGDEDLNGGDGQIRDFYQRYRKVFLLTVAIVLALVASWVLKSSTLSNERESVHPQYPRLDGGEKGQSEDERNEMIRIKWKQETEKSMRDLVGGMIAEQDDSDESD